jgi:hypothetical protein
MTPSLVAIAATRTSPTPLRLLAADFGVVLGDIEDAALRMPQRHHRRPGRGLDVERARALGHSGRCARPIDLAVAQHGGLDAEGTENAALERDHAAHAHAADAFGFEIERVVFDMGRARRRVGPGDALRNQPVAARRQRRGHEVARAFGAHAGVAMGRFGHQLRIEVGGQVGELMHDDRGPDANERRAKRLGIEHIDDDRRHAPGLERMRAVGAARAAVHVVARLGQQRNQRGADGTRRTRHEYLLAH